MPERLIICGGARRAGGDSILSLALSGRSQNISLKLEDISKKLIRNIPSLLVDLIEIATYVYSRRRRCIPFSDLSGQITSITTAYPGSIKCPTLRLPSFWLVFCFFPFRRLPMRWNRSRHYALGSVFKRSGRLKRK
jgi:hypothetical protein